MRSTEEAGRVGDGITCLNAYPDPIENSHQNWDPPVLFQRVCRSGPNSIIMRLLRTEEASPGRYEVETCLDNDIPPYAILSHTWGDGELTFQDVEAGRGQAKPGFEKLCQRESERVRPYLERHLLH